MSNPTPADVIAEGERLLAAAQGRPWNIRAQVFEGLRPEDRKALIWTINNADALLAGMRALVEMAQLSELTYDRPSVRIMRLTMKAAQDAVARFAKETTDG